FNRRSTPMSTFLNTSRATTTTTFWRSVPWLNRLILLAPLALMMLLTVSILADPVHSAAEHGMSLVSPAGLTNYRSGNGGLFLTVAIFTFYCLLFVRRHLLGLSVIALLTGTILGLRVVSAMVDATVPEQMPLLVVETVLLTLSLAGLFLERGRR